MTYNRNGKALERYGLMKKTLYANTRFVIGEALCRTCVHAHFGPLTLTPKKNPPRNGYTPPSGVSLGLVPASAITKKKTTGLSSSFPKIQRKRPAPNSMAKTRQWMCRNAPAETSIVTDQKGTCPLGYEPLKPGAQKIRDQLLSFSY